LHCFVGAAANDDWRRGIRHIDRLAAATEISARIRCLPSAGCIKSAAAVACGVSDRVDYSDGIAAATIRSGGRIEGPGGA